MSTVVRIIHAKRKGTAAAAPSTDGVSAHIRFAAIVSLSSELAAQGHNRDIERVADVTENTPRSMDEMSDSKSCTTLVG